MSQLTPDDERSIRDVETMKAVSHPLRLQLLKLMRDPITVKEMAAHLNVAASKLYYHVNLLEKQALIRVVDINIETGIVEKQYQVTARQFKIRNPILMGDAVSADEVTALFESLLDETKEGFWEAYRLGPPTGESTPPRHPFFTKKAFKLTDEQLTQLHAKLDALIKEIDQWTATNETLETRPFNLTIAFYQSTEEHQ